MTRLEQGPFSAAGHQGSRTTAGPSRCRLALRAEKDCLHGDITTGQWQRWKIEEFPAAALYPVSALVAIKVLKVPAHGSDFWPSCAVRKIPALLGFLAFVTPRVPRSRVFRRFPSDPRDDSSPRPLQTQPPTRHRVADS